MDYLNTPGYWGNSYWGGSYWGVLVLVPFNYAEIWDGFIQVRFEVDEAVKMNRLIAQSVKMNRTIQQANYSELESI